MIRTFLEVMALVMCSYAVSYFFGTDVKEMLLITILTMVCAANTKKND